MFAVRLSVLSLVVLSLSACDTVGPARATSGLNLMTPEVIDWRALSQDPEALVGTWDLVSYINLEAPIPGTNPQEFGIVLYTPESMSRTETVVVRADGTATRRSVTLLSSGPVVYEATYRVVRRPFEDPTAGDYILQPDAGGYGEDFGTDGDVLILDNTPVDGPQSRYRRR